MTYNSTISGHSGMNTKTKKLTQLFIGRECSKMCEIISDGALLVKYLIAYLRMLQPLPIPNKVFTYITLYFVKSIPKS